MESQEKFATSASSVIVLDEPEIITPSHGRQIQPFRFQDVEDNSLPPQVIGQVDNRRDFSAPLPYGATEDLVQTDLYIKAPGTKFYIPRELEGQLEFIQKGINHHYSSGRSILHEYCRLQIRQASFIAAGYNIHIDAHYGDVRAGKFHNISAYISYDKAPTVFFEGPFSIQAENSKHKNYTKEFYAFIREQFQQQSLTKKRIQFGPYSIVSFDSTAAHHGLDMENMGVRTVSILRFERNLTIDPKHFNNQALDEAVENHRSFANNSPATPILRRDI